MDPGTLSPATCEHPRRPKQWAVNVRGPYALTVAALPHLRAGGGVIVISSAAGRVGVRRASAYSVTKGAPSR